METWIEGQAREWGARFGRDDPGRIGWLGAAAYPYGPAERAVLATNVIQWVFMIDDEFDQPAVVDRWRAARLALVANRIAECPGSINPGGEPCLAALDSVVRRVWTVASPAQYERFSAGVTEFLLGELASTVTDDRVTIPDYETLRRYSGACMTLFALIDVVAGVELHPAMWRSPSLVGLRRLANQIICSTNDIYSAGKEARERHPTNLPVLLARQRPGASFTDAMERTVEQIAGQYRRFQQAVARVRAGPHAPGPVLAHVDGLEAWLAAHHHWCATTSRYREESPVATPEATLHLTAYQQQVARWWNERTADSDRANLPLGRIDGLYHHHYGIGPADPHVLAIAAGPAGGQHAEQIIAELHRMETVLADHVLDQLGDIGPGERLLDAGCGRGGTAFMAHRRFGCQVDGVSISRRQVDFANHQAGEWDVAGQVQFHLRNMLDTGFPPMDFRAAWNIESTMYVDLDELFAELVRLLRPGGRWVCITGARNDAWGMAEPPAVARINDRYDCRVHARGDYFTAMARAGLVPVTVENLTARTIPYWELRAHSPVATGVEQDFLDTYNEGSFQYLLIAADRR